MTRKTLCLLCFNRVDKAGLALAAVVAGLFLTLWVLLMFVAGPAPTHHLSMICLNWFVKAEGLLVLPLWFCARAVQVLLHFARAGMEEANPPARRLSAFTARSSAALSSTRADIWAAG
jgi:hypothetical protein